MSGKRELVHTPTELPTWSPAVVQLGFFLNDIQSFTADTDQLWVDSNNENLYVMASECYRINLASNTVSLFGGASNDDDYISQTDGGQATSTSIDFGIGVFGNSVGQLFIVENLKSKIHVIDMSTGVIELVAGTDSTGYNGDNIDATSAKLFYPCHLTGDTDGSLYVTETNNRRVRRVAYSTGIITTYAGNGNNAVVDSPSATSGSFEFPRGITIDTVGRVYVCEHYGSIRMVSVAGALTTIAGAGSSSSGGDGGLAVDASIFGAHGLWVSSMGYLFIAEFGNHIRMIDLNSGVISTVEDDGGTEMSIVAPNSVYGTSDGTVFLSSYSKLVRVLSESAPTLLPTIPPSERPSIVPTVTPTAPTIVPTIGPTFSPTKSPSRSPTVAPFVTSSPSKSPTVVPTFTNNPVVAESHASSGSGGDSSTGIVAGVVGGVGGFLLIFAVLLWWRRFSAKAKKTADVDLAMQQMTNRVAPMPVDLESGDGKSSSVRLAAAVESEKIEYTDVFLTHDWGVDEQGRDNHVRVSRVNDALKRRGLITWFDAERMTGSVRKKMTDGIERTAVVVVFVTDKYRNKVNGVEERDNCRYEFTYAVEQKGPQSMVAVVMEPRMQNSRLWKGELGAALGNKLYVDMTEDEDSVFESKCDELASQVRMVLDK